MMLGQIQRMMASRDDPMKASYAAGHPARNHLARKQQQRPPPPARANPEARGGGDDGMRDELWDACAGPLAHVPKVGDYVYYFLQGHIQQVKSCIEQDYEEVIISSWKEAEAEEEEEDGSSSNSSNHHSWNNPNQLGVLTKKEGKRSFSKKLTPSDTSKHGGFSVPRRQAEECLPPLNMSEDPPVQEITTKDIHNNLWRFRHIYRGDPKRHLFTSGWSTFATSKRISPGDQFIFVRGANGELRVGVRRGSRQHQHHKKPPPSASVISANCVIHGILADASRAVTSGSTFVVYYRPWSNSSEFLIPAGRYLKSAKIEYSPGTRFRMLFEGDECTEQRVERFEGTIVGNDPVDPLHWRDSEWERLKVKWDATSDTLERPERVSSWNIDPIEPVRMKLSSPSGRHLKRSRDFLFKAATASGFQGVHPFKGNFIAARMLHNPFLLQSLNLEAFQEQNKNKNKKRKTEERNDPKPPITIPHWLNLNSTSTNPTMPHDLPQQGQTEAGWTMKNQDDLSLRAVPAKTSWPVGPPGDKYYSSSSSSSSQERKEDTNETLLPSPPSVDQGKCMVFGVNILTNKTETEFPSPQIVTVSDDVSETPATAGRDLSDSVIVPLPTSQHSNGGGVSETISYKPTRVLKHGSQLGRMVDLAKFNGHEHLVRELDQMFGFRGGLVDGTSSWHVTYFDVADRDTSAEIMFPIADREWQQLLSVAHKLCICPIEAN
ncbi:Auxin response factor 7 [Linum perenne]